VSYRDRDERAAEEGARRLVVPAGDPTHGTAARLVRRGWLYRALEVDLRGFTHRVIYDGRGFGYEQVVFDGVVIRGYPRLWFIPRFEFRLGGLPASVEVRVWPWLGIRSLELRLQGVQVYAEGRARHESRK
jgi:hypothetical protein